MSSTTSTEAPTVNAEADLLRRIVAKIVGQRNNLHDALAQAEVHVETLTAQLKDLQTATEKRIQEYTDVIADLRFQLTCNSTSPASGKG